MTRGRIRGALSPQEAESRLELSDSFSRMSILLDLEPQMRAEDWRALLGKWWTTCDNIGVWLPRLRRLLPREGPILEMMDADECAALHALPDDVTVYRGCGPSNVNGASWTLRRDVAAKFPFMNRYMQPEPLLLTASVPKSRVLAIKLDRKEFEVVTFDAVVVQVDRLKGGVA